MEINSPQFIKIHLKTVTNHSNFLKQLPTFKLHSENLNLNQNSLKFQIKHRTRQLNLKESPANPLTDLLPKCFTTTTILKLIQPLLYKRTQGDKAKRLRKIRKNSFSPQGLIPALLKCQQREILKDLLLKETDHQVKMASK